MLFIAKEGKQSLQDVFIFFGFTKMFYHKGIFYSKKLRLVLYIFIILKLLSQFYAKAIEEEKEEEELLLLYILKCHI